MNKQYFAEDGVKQLWMLNAQAFREEAKRLTEEDIQIEYKMKTYKKNGLIWKHLNKKLARNEFRITDCIKRAIAEENRIREYYGSLN